MIALTEEPIRTAEWTARLARPEAGAVVTFEGVVRNSARGRKVTRLEYHAYRPMALLQMEKIRRQALEQFPILDAALVHRLGTLAIGETSVLVVVVSAHREPALAACRYCINTLKQTVPIWKKEYGEGGESWIEGEQAVTIHEPSI
ncbi:MAG: molybdenum cofactor biosynthesis protein MoaE [Acidobacteria bacterium]|nr:molybdenum cofactor biosynthesis protein MoaE [Acidobacteriota bacterium]